MSSAFAATAGRSIIYVGMDVHKDWITIAGLPAAPLCVAQLVA
jgi:hypothetical protein